MTIRRQKSLAFQTLRGVNAKLVQDSDLTKLSDNLLATLKADGVNFIWLCLEITADSLTGHTLTTAVTEAVFKTAYDKIVDAGFMIGFKPHVIYDNSGSRYNPSNVSSFFTNYTTLFDTYIAVGSHWDYISMSNELSLITVPANLTSWETLIDATRLAYPNAKITATNTEEFFKEKQVETATVVGTVTGDGDAEVIVTSANIITSPITLSVAVLNTDTDAIVATKIRTALVDDLFIGHPTSGKFTVTGTGSNIVLTAKDYTPYDDTLNISIDNGTCTGLTTANTSTHTTGGYLDLLDYIGLNFYPRMTTSLNYNTDDLITGMFRDLYDREGISDINKVSDGFDKKIIITEIGITAFIEAVRLPSLWGYSIEDETAQTKFYKAFMEIIRNMENVHGICIWSVLDGFTFVGKDAENVIKSNWGNSI
jgi:hypothetical protein